MHILIVEDEPPIARYLEDLTREILGDRVTKVSVTHHLTAAEALLEKKKIDLLLLDLNLNGRDGYKLLEMVVSEPFHTIIVSANADRAIKAFEYGVLDFVSKPFTKDRLQVAYDKFNSLPKHGGQLKFLSFKTRGIIKIVDVSQVKYIKGSRNYSEVHFKDGSSLVHDKSLDTLIKILPDNFYRIHRSYITDLRLVDRILISKGSIYNVQLNDGTKLPVGRTRYKNLRSRLNS